MSLAAFLDSLATCNTVQLAATQIDEHLLRFPWLWDCKADLGSGRKSRVQSAPSDRLRLLFVFIKSFCFFAHQTAASRNAVEEDLVNGRFSP